MSNVTIDKETRERVTALAKRRKDAECKDGTTFDTCLAWCVSVGVKRQDTLDRFAANKKKERRAEAKGTKKPAKKSGKAAKKAASKKPAAKKPAKAAKPKAAKKSGKRGAKKAAEAPVDKAAE